MRLMISKWLPIGVIVFLPFAALADSTDSSQSGSPVASIISSLSTLALVVGLIIWAVRRQKQTTPFMRLQEQHRIRSEQYMERVEALLERMVVALEKNDKGRTKAQPSDDPNRPGEERQG
jgi:hypothetical protein